MDAVDQRIDALMRSNEWTSAARSLSALLRKRSDDHFLLLKRGLCDHERHRYSKALPWFAKAAAAAPHCPCAQYNLANTLFMLKREGEAFAILSKLAAMSPDMVEDACADADEDGAGFVADVHYLLFQIVIEREQDYAAAAPYLQRHLALRKGHRSLWPLRVLRREVKGYRKEYERG